MINMKKISKRSCPEHIYMRGGEAVLGKLMLETYEKELVLGKLSSSHSCPKH